MISWRLLLSRTIVGLEQLQQQGQAVPAWTLGGGTALMLHADHRLSKDIEQGLFHFTPHFPIGTERGSNQSTNRRRKSGLCSLPSRLLIACGFLEVEQ